MSNMKMKVSCSIEKEVLDRLENYLSRKKKILGTKASKSSIIELALANELIRLNKDLDQHQIDKRGLSVVP